jgi:hypothetical protein
MCASRAVALLALLQLFTGGAAAENETNGEQFCEKNSNLCDRVFRVFESQAPQSPDEGRSTPVESHQGAIFSVISSSHLSSSLDRNTFPKGKPVAMLFVEMWRKSPGNAMTCGAWDIKETEDKVYCAQRHPRQRNIVEVLIVGPGKCGERSTDFSSCADYEVRYCTTKSYRDCGDLCQIDKKELAYNGQNFTVAKQAPEQGSGTGGSRPH